MDANQKKLTHMNLMKSMFIAAVLSAGAISETSAQNIVFSGYLAPDGAVHTATPSVADKQGNIFVAGGTRGGLKVTNDAFQKSYKGHTDGDATGGDAFLMKLSPEGKLIYSTYIGGSGSENYCGKMAIDEAGNVYVGFTTDSRDLPVSGSAVQRTLKGENHTYRSNLFCQFSGDEKCVSKKHGRNAGWFFHHHQ